MICVINHTLTHSLRSNNKKIENINAIMYGLIPYFITFFLHGETVDSLSLVLLKQIEFLSEEFYF